MSSAIGNIHGVYSVKMCEHRVCAIGNIHGVYSVKVCEHRVCVIGNIHGVYSVKVCEHSVSTTLHSYAICNREQPWGIQCEGV